jgi:hypothetical protein
MKFKFFIILFSIFILPINAWAQSTPPESIDGIVLTTTPENPAPGDTVTITVQDYQSDINKAKITWVINGKESTKGTGLNKITVTAPASGKRVDVMAVIETVEGADIRKVLNIKSGDIDMIWETGGYTPPLYRGKTQFSYQNYLKVVAFPHFIDSSGKQVKPSQLIYKWKKDGTALQDQSGFGKQSLVIKADIIPRPFSITVDVSSLDSTAHGVGELIFEATSPAILFYEDSPLYGVFYNKAVGDKILLSNAEVKIMASPYGFNMNDSLRYEWSINNLIHDELAQNKNIVLRINGTDQGRSDISLTMKNVGDDILQTATGVFSALFNGQKQGSSNVTF